MKNRSREPIVIFWFRRDLRLEGNTGLTAALNSGYPLMPVFIFDRNILDRLEDKADRRVSFIHTQAGLIKTSLEERYASTLHIYYGFPLVLMQQMIREVEVHAVYANEDYEPYAIDRDNAIRKMLGEHDIPLLLSKDHVIFAKDEVVKDDGKPYTVFTPYRNKWLKQLENTGYEDDSLQNTHRFRRSPPVAAPALRTLGFEQSAESVAPPTPLTSEWLRMYERLRDYPSENGTSHLGVHLRFGTVSIRRLVRLARQYSSAFLNELIWREFFQQILWHFPDVTSRNFRRQYDRIEWRNHELEFEAWCRGMTGYPLVDAGMRELNATGYMHNRVRMVVASFLTKHLLIDWRWGEAYFAGELLDFELASNNGNWQWAAGTGCDAAPYFRIFNPTEQARKFDSEQKYVRRWIQELGTSRYPLPIVDHSVARDRALRAYRKAVVSA